jgi:cyclin-dependent kinase 9
MKAANILITKKGVLKLADFGLARPYSLGQVNRYTNRVVTLWYRPPELLLGDRNYGPPVDCWGAGCIMAEMWTRSPIMQVRFAMFDVNFFMWSVVALSTSLCKWPDSLTNTNPC